MPKKQHTEAEIISALKRYEGGDKTTNICRKLVSARPRSTCGRSNMPGWADLPPGISLLIINLTAME